MIRVKKNIFCIISYTRSAESGCKAISDIVYHLNFILKNKAPNSILFSLEWWPILVMLHFNES